MIAKALSIILIVALFAPAIASATWYQPGYDAGRTGAIPEPGPEFGDIAFVTQLNGTPMGQFAIDDGAVYVGTSADGETNTAEQTAAWQIDLDTARVKHLFDLPDNVEADTNLLFDQDQAYLFDGRDYVAWDRETGKELWRWPVPNAGQGYIVICSIPAVESEHLYVVCWPSGFINDDPMKLLSNDDTEPAWMVLAKLERTTGEEQWAIVPPVTEDARLEEDEPGRVPGPGGFPLYVTISAGAGRVFLYTTWGAQSCVADRCQPETPDGVEPPFYAGAEYMIWSFSATSSDLQWSVTGEQRMGVQYGPLPSGTGLDPPQGTIYVGGFPLVGPDALFIRMDRFQALNLATGDPIWESDIGQADAQENMGGTSLALRDDVLIGTSTQTAYRFDPDNGELVWEHRLPADADFGYGVSPATLTDDRVYLSLFICTADGEGGGFQALDAETGREVWRWKTIRPVSTSRPCWRLADPAHGEGVIVNGERDGVVTVLGQSGASLEPVLSHTGSTPAVGEQIQIDLSGTRDGVHGPATRFKADWGDGTHTDWQENPIFSHTYNESGPVTAQFTVGNEEQTTTTTMTFRVGYTPPNFLEEAFARDNQDLTFGVLGIVVALTGGMLALGHRRARRSRLQRERELIDEAYRRNEHDPARCEAALRERRAHIDGLLLDGKIDDGQFALLENRIEELHRELRLATVDDEFDLLPHRLVRSIRDILDDGRVSEMEMEGFLTALEQEKAITSAYKKRVRARVEAWYRRDKGVET